MTAAIGAAHRSLDLVISLSSWQTRYSSYLITRLAFELRYSGTRQLIFECGITVTRSGFDFLVALQEMIWSPAHRQKPSSPLRYMSELGHEQT